MLTVVPEIPLHQGVKLNPLRKLWTRTECELMDAAGLFDHENVELVEGELITKMGKNRPHALVGAMFLEWLFRVFPGGRVNSESPIDVLPEDNPTNEPQPDAFVLKPVSAFLKTTPRPDDVALVVEVSDTSLNYDLSVKAGLYARACIVDYWVLDVSGRRLIVHREPVAGQYQSIAIYGNRDEVAPLAAPNPVFHVASVFVD